MAVAFTEEFKMPRVVERKELGLPPAYVVTAEDLSQTFMPWTIQPLSETMPISGFMDSEGNVHFEFNHSTFRLRPLIKYGALLRPAFYYQTLVREFLATSVLQNERRFVAGGHALYNFKTRDCHLISLMILPRPLCPDMDPKIRRQAIFLFQEAFDRMVVRLGGEYSTTSTLVIPHEKMEALGWNLMKSKGFKGKWAAFKAWWPISLRGPQRGYVKRYGTPPNLEATWHPRPTDNLG